MHVLHLIVTFVRWQSVMRDLFVICWLVSTWHVASSCLWLVVWGCIVLLAIDGLLTFIGAT